jgi:hypothetical protein
MVLAGSESLKRTVRRLSLRKQSGYENCVFNLLLRIRGFDNGAAIPAGQLVEVYEEPTSKQVSSSSSRVSI